MQGFLLLTAAKEERQGMDPCCWMKAITVYGLLLLTEAKEQGQGHGSLLFNAAYNRCMGYFCWHWARSRGTGQCCWLKGRSRSSRSRRTQTMTTVMRAGRVWNQLGCALNKRGQNGWALEYVKLRPVFVFGKWNMVKSRNKHISTNLTFFSFHIF